MIFNRLHPRILVAILKSRLRGKYKGGNLFKLEYLWYHGIEEYINTNTKHDREFVLRNKDTKIKTQAQQNFTVLRIKYTSYIYIQKKIHREQCSTGGKGNRR